MYIHEKVDAFYPLVIEDADGDSLDGKANHCIPHAKEDEIPPDK